MLDHVPGLVKPHCVGVAAENLDWLNSDSQASAMFDWAAGSKRNFDPCLVVRQDVGIQVGDELVGVVCGQSREKNISILNRPKKSSHTELSGEHPLRGME